MATRTEGRGNRPAIARMDDDDLAGLVAVGDRDAFEQLYDRHSAGVLALCRHILHSSEEAEDALQHTFGVAFRELSRGERPTNMRAWLYTVARNRCITLLRGRRELPAELPDAATAGLPEEVERRADVRELVGDLGRLPEEQRVALVLSQLADLDHSEVAEVLGCPPERVRALVYQARTNLSGWREARERPCRDVRTQISAARAGELRRADLRRHLQVCDDCAAFHEQIVEQRRKIAVLLPAGPAILLKEGVLEAAFAAGGAAAAGSAGAAAGAAAGEAAGSGAAAGAAVGAAEAGAVGAAGAGAAGAGVAAATAIKIGATALVLGGAGLGVTGGLPGGSDEPETGPPDAERQDAGAQVADSGPDGPAAQATRAERRGASAERRSPGGSRTTDGSRPPSTSAPAPGPAPTPVESPGTPIQAPGVQTPETSQPPPAPRWPATPEAPQTPVPEQAPVPEQPPASDQTPAPGPTPEPVESPTLPEVEADVPEPPTDELVP
jgi:RNA polymerase sigma factor (sigma-70 family)